ncbi:hypothetical protein [Entomospira culicis]|uniref:Uncharacterized protein n=1 Tax=Entomospira culicis TaxID=2719989 RepID=A0A968GJE8_9SPIO|nr:hypothetical protein [Entomospira culicis]NIZ19901.1 hypothetical protein [Entomospira culicis]NIZ70142.1 hypothetical protein [Entomospira culicis]WDI38069.1 hypothetical protein PVA46_07975 [Entomospira culicis]WDI39692.1 hypothetical protein PVA47_07975 [Entomospira culicis]
MFQDAYLTFFILFFSPLIGLTIIFFVVLFWQSLWQKRLANEPHNTELSLKVARLIKVRKILMVIITIWTLLLMLFVHQNLKLTPPTE